MRRCYILGYGNFSVSTPRWVTCGTQVGGGGGRRERLVSCEQKLHHANGQKKLAPLRVKNDSVEIV